MNQLKAQEEGSPPVEAHGTGQRSSEEQSRESKELHLVAWDVEDAGNPKNWSIKLQLGMLAFVSWRQDFRLLQDPCCMGWALAPRFQC